MFDEDKSTWSLIKNQDTFDSLDIALQRSSHLGQASVYFSSGKIREILKKLQFETVAAFYFIRTVVNPEAKKALENKKMKRIYSFDSEEEYLKMHIDLKDKNKHRELTFNKGLMDLYLSTMDAMIKPTQSEHVQVFPYYAHYSMLETNNAYDDVPQFGFANVPIIHVLGHRDPAKYQKFIDVLESLGGRGKYSDEIFKIIKRNECPQNYHMGEIKYLREKNIVPFIVESEAEFSGENLKKFVDFLIPFTLSRINHDYNSDY